MSRALNDLHPLVQPLCLRHQEIAQDHGLRVSLIETYRNEAKQLEAWKIGRDEHGNIVGPVVTHARPGQSWHGTTYPNGTPASFAYHLAIIRPGGLLGLGTPAGVGDPMDRAAELLYEALALIGEKLGLVAGARFRMKDWMHFELRPNGATLVQVREVMQRQGDIPKVLSI